jgi:O-6-methylguanine DNA methyltransferase
MKATFQACAVPTRDGTFVAYYTEKGLARLDFPNGKTPRCEEPTGEAKIWHKVTRRAVEQIMDGKDVTSTPPLDLSGGTDFQRAVWLAMQKIACGRTETYAEIAAAIHKPKATRATGSACGANPIPLLIPCHRVLASGGKIGGFSSGLDWKRKLLARENVTGFRG